MIRGGAETETHTGEFGIVIAAVVADLRDGDPGSVPGESQCGVDQGVSREPGVDTVDVQRGAAVTTRRAQRFLQPPVGVVR